MVVLDVAFASEASSGGFEKITRPFIDGLGARLAAWVDHHDHVKHADYAGDPRFVLATKAQHGACPEMVTPEVVARAGKVDTIVCHTDFDGLCSAAKWMRGGVEPYPGADDDARAIDTRMKLASLVGQRFDRALRGRPRDTALFGLIVRHLATGLADPSLFGPVDAAASAIVPLEEVALGVARRYEVLDAHGVPGIHSVAFVDATAEHGRFDKTMLLLLGQERAAVAALRSMDNLTLAAPFDSGIDFLRLLGLSGGMPTLVSIPSTKTEEALTRLGVAMSDASRLS